MSHCIFCKMVAGSIPLYRVWEDENFLAILSIFPNTEGMTVVFPKKHYSSYIFDQEADVIHELMKASQTVARLLEKSFEDTARCGVIFEGFGVDHLHSKLYPMHGTANLKKWQSIENTRTEYYEQYLGFLSSHDAPQASSETLEKTLYKIQNAYK